MATETDYTRKCQQLDVLIDLLEREMGAETGGLDELERGEQE